MPAPTSRLSSSNNAAWRVHVRTGGESRASIRAGKLTDNDYTVTKGSAPVESGGQTISGERTGVAEGNDEKAKAPGEEIAAVADDGGNIRTKTVDGESEASKPHVAEVQDEGEVASRRAVEDEASAHLASRAAQLTLDTDVNSQSRSPGNKTDGKRTDGALPMSPPAPAPPRKDTTDVKGKAKAEVAEYDEKKPEVDPNTSEMPEPSSDAAEQTGEEIQTIMDQFQDEVTSPGEEEIMSPRLQKQQPIMHVPPPRSSSLEPASSYVVSPKPAPARRDTGDFFTAAGSKVKSPSDTQANASTAGTDGDAASVISQRTSIFQPPPPSPDPEPALPFDFHRFLEQLRHRTADPVARFLRSFLSEFGKKQWAVHEQVKIIGDFLEFIAKKMSQCEVWRSVSDAEFDNAREGMEKLVMNRLYSQTFSPAIPPVLSSPRKVAKGGRSAMDAANPNGPGRRGQHEEDVERDTVIAQKIRIYGWIKEEHLDIESINDKGRSFLTLAQQELLKINTYRAPRDKVICVLNTCKVIFGFLKNSKSDQGADAFVPLLIYTVLRAAPEHLVSNVQYIWRFRNAEKLGGEAGYYMSSLMGAVTFIEGLDRTSLTISDEEFEQNVEHAVSAIAEGHKAEEYENRAHVSSNANSSQGTSGLQPLNEKGSISKPEVTPRTSMEGEKATSPRKQRPSEKSTSTQRSDPSSPDSDIDAVTGLLRTIQKPLSSIGRMFSDDQSQPAQQSGLKPAATPLPGATPRRGLSPGERPERTSSRQRVPDQQAVDKARAEDAAARQASAEMAQAQARRVREEGLVVETLQGMFPSLDKEVIEDVVRAQAGNVGRAVHAWRSMDDGRHLAT
nr:hypothetical protein B0A51_12239 [Rachicladosporium sp. CCFEE 5018]